MAARAGRRALVLRARARQALCLLVPLIIASLFHQFIRSANLMAAPLGDTAPAILSVHPPPNSQGISLHEPLAISFSEPVSLAVSAVELTCKVSGLHPLSMTGGPTEYDLLSSRAFLPGETCVVTVRAVGVTDTDKDDPPDIMLSDYFWTFNIVDISILINEIDTTTSGGTKDFVELYDGGKGQTDLTGLTLVLYRGDEHSVYLAVALDGFRTDEKGYFVIGAAGTPNVDLLLAAETLRNGPDAAAVYAAPKSQFPRNAPITFEHLLDAVVYGPADAELLTLLLAGQNALDENSRGTALTDSSQRCPNGDGWPRKSAAFIQTAPTSGEDNNCPVDDPPTVSQVTPAPGATGVPVDTDIAVTFSEPVTLHDAPLEVVCDRSGKHDYSIEGSGAKYRFRLTKAPTAGELCSVSIFPEEVSDSDSYDPPDKLMSLVTWQFRTAIPLAEHILINEVDTDTPGTDTSEFIELYDGGTGNTKLDGLSVVLLNGSDDQSYLAIDLDGLQTDDAGYFLLANAAVPGADLVLPNTILQNGPDAVAIVAGDASAIPNGTSVSNIKPLDALVYGQSDDVELLILLNSGQPQVNENARGDAANHSMNRCPNGTGGQRNTSTYQVNTPTPGKTNNCIIDQPPQLVSASPPAGATNVPTSPAISLEFSEPVAIASSAVSLTCNTSGPHTLTKTGGTTVFNFTPNEVLAYSETCVVSVKGNQVTDLDSDDPPDGMTQDVSWSFTTRIPPADSILINEIDADTPGTDKAEFIELYDGGRGNTDLTGLAIVLYNGSDDRAYYAIDLDGAHTNAGGYLVIGNASISGANIILPDGKMQNGADAVALYAGAASAFPNGTLLHGQGLRDAVVYGTSDPTDNGLLALLEVGQPQIDEAGRGAAEMHSIGRCPNGEGGLRRTAAYRPDIPTPFTANSCTNDQTPAVSSVTPAPSATDVPLDAGLTVTFNEAVSLDSGWLELICDTSGAHALKATGGPVAFQVTVAQPFAGGEQCVATVRAAKVRDVDPDDPPDSPAGDYAWSFKTVAAANDFVLINEVDANTPGNDTAEFIELYDGGIGKTNLAGLVIVLWNGKDDKAYKAIELNGLTSENGYFVIGNPGVDGVNLTFNNGTMQNGPDAVALYQGRASDFPSDAPLTTANLIDAIVYGPATNPDTDLLKLLNHDQSQVDEGGYGSAESHSLQRCPNGDGGARNTAPFGPDVPTPGDANQCASDSPPDVILVSPANGAIGVPPHATLTIRFDEDVVVDDSWFDIQCGDGSPLAAAVTGGPREYTLLPSENLPTDTTCDATLFASAIHDLDVMDPPDNLAEDYHWSFHTEEQKPTVVAGFTSNSPVWIGENVVFTNTSSGPEPLSFSWDFGDGSPHSTDKNPIHLYATPGIYTVILTVSADSGHASHHANVQVRTRVFIPISATAAGSPVGSDRYLGGILPQVARVVRFSYSQVMTTESNT